MANIPLRYNVEIQNVSAVASSSHLPEGKAHNTFINIGKQVLSNENICTVRPTTARWRHTKGEGVVINC